MADRTVKVNLVATVNGYISGLQQAQKATKALTDDTKAKAAEQSAALKNIGNTAGIALTAFGAVAAAAVGLAIKKFADFDAAMAQVQTLSHATAAEMTQLTDAALTMGQKIGFSATEVAEAEAELVKAGISVTDIMGGSLKGALELAAAGQIDVADATQIAAEAMTQFGLKGKDVPHIADLLAAGADKALGSVGDLGQALESGGLVAAQFGLSIEDTVGTLSAFAQAGLIGETAGTDLRQMLLKLANPSADAAKTMKDLGITLYDASGQFVGITNLSGQLKGKMEGLTPATRNAALATIFGSRAIAGANVLYKNGQSGIQGWIDKVNDSGFATQQAEGKMDSLQGDVKKLGAAFDTALIKSGSAANGVLRDLVTGVTSAIQGFSGLPPIVQQGALALTALVAVVALAGGGFLLAIPKLVEFQAALITLSASEIPAVAAAATAMMGATTKAAAAMSATAKFLTGPWGVALAAAVVGVHLLSQYLDSLKASTSEVENSLKTATDAQQAFQKAGQGQLALQSLDGMYKKLNDLSGVLDVSAKRSKDFWSTFSLDAFNQSDQAAAERTLKDIGTALAGLAKTDLPSAQHGFSVLAERTNGSQKELWRLLSTMPDYKQALIDQANAQGVNVTTDDEAVNKKRLLKLAQEQGTSAAKENEAALAKLSGTATDTTGAVSDLADAISNFGKGALDVSSAERDFQAAIDDLTDSVTKNGATLDINTEAGRENSAALDNIAKTTVALGSAQATAGASQDELTATMQTGRDAFIAAAEAAGLTADQAINLANQYGLIPTSVNTAFNVTGADAAVAAANRVKDSIASIQRSIDIAVNLHGAGNLATTGGLRIAEAQGAVLDFFANGGFENHTAQIAPAGTTRVWNEPETGGEAYIPLAPSKRGRSLEIWQDTGARLGVQGYANGGTYVPAPQQYATAPSTSAAAGLRPITNNIYDARDPVGTAQAVARRQQLLGA